MEDIMKIVSSLQDADLLNQTIQNEIKKQRSGFLGILSEALGTNLLGNMLAAEGMTRPNKGAKTTRQRRRIIPASKRTTKRRKHVF